jgi:hypothetical protein
LEISKAFLETSKFLSVKSLLQTKTKGTKTMQNIIQFPQRNEQTITHIACNIELRDDLLRIANYLDICSPLTHQVMAMKDAANTVRNIANRVGQDH